jgi:hypothetical protein
VGAEVGAGVGAGDVVRNGETDGALVDSSQRQNRIIHDVFEQSYELSEVPSGL